MTAYKVTAANLYFWQTLVVLAPSDHEAHRRFCGYLAEPEQQANEEEELSMGVSIAMTELGESVPERDEYRYRMREEDVKECDYFPHWTGTPTDQVQVIGSGGNS